MNNIKRYMQVIINNRKKPDNKQRYTNKRTCKQDKNKHISIWP